jgi:16S rRNA (guanine527-N7)-methyltransferase
VNAARGDLQALPLGLLETLSPATRSDLDRYIELLRSWQAAHNLVSPNSLTEVWSRHVADSLQVLDLAPADFKSWVDLGSGAGFPGLVAAIASKSLPHRRFQLIEANQKKAAFLRAVIRETGAPAAVQAVRIEEFAVSWKEEVNVVSARALASVATVCSLAAPLVGSDTVLLLPKGRDFSRELEEASGSWLFDVVSTQSVTDSQARVLAIRNLRPRRLP